MERAADAHNRIAEAYPLAAQYVLPLAYRIRVLFTWNLRELFHIIQLRSAKQGHFSCRRIAQQVYSEVERIQPTRALYPCRSVGLPAWQALRRPQAIDEQEQS
jgi:Thymidylate synthase complementing protein